MTVRKILSLALVALFAGTSFGQVYVTSAPSDHVGAGITYKVFATTTGDIVSLEDVTLEMTGGLQIFNLGPPFGADTQDNCLDFGGFEPRACEDSWVTTPGSTNVLVNNGTDPIQSQIIPLSTWADFTNDGAQTDFQIAQITTIPGPPHVGDNLLRGTLQFVGSTGGVEPMPFAVTVPEPATAVLSLLAGLALLAFRRR